MGNFGKQTDQYCENSGESIIEANFKQNVDGKIKCSACGRLVKTTPHPCIAYGQIIIAPHKRPEYLKTKRLI